MRERAGVWRGISCGGIAIGGGDRGESPDVGRPGDPVALSDEPRIFVYDAYPGGIGFSEPLFAMDRELRVRTRELIAAKRPVRVVFYGDSISEVKPGWNGSRHTCN